MWQIVQLPASDSLTPGGPRFAANADATGVFVTATLRTDAAPIGAELQVRFSAIVGRLAKAVADARILADAGVLREQAVALSDSRARHLAEAGRLANERDALRVGRPIPEDFATRLTSLEQGITAETAAAELAGKSLAAIAPVLSGEQRIARQKLGETIGRFIHAEAMALKAEIAAALEKDPLRALPGAAVAELLIQRLSTAREELFELIAGDVLRSVPGTGA